MEILSFSLPLETILLLASVVIPVAMAVLVFILGFVMINAFHRVERRIESLELLVRQKRN